MQKTKLTVRVDEDTLCKAKRYAERRGTNLSRLVNAFLGGLADDELSHEDTPILRRLTGSLKPCDAPGEYGEFLERKYMRADSLAHPG